MIENPNKKYRVCNIAHRFKPLISFNSVTDTPGIYDKKLGYSESVQGEAKERAPAPKAMRYLISPFRQNLTSVLFN